MDLYLLTPSFVLDDIIDVFDSLIWTERYSAAGEITLVIPANSKFKDVLVEGRFLSIPQSKEVMEILTVATKDGAITIQGKTLVDILSRRMLRNTWNTNASSWQINGTPPAIANYMVAQMCMPGGVMASGAVLPAALAANELIPNLIMGTTAAGTITTIPVAYGDLYSAVKMVCDLDSVGFNLYPTNIFPSGFYDLVFNTYRGLDRTSTQSTNNVVIFESAMDSFTDIEELRSIDGYKTVAWVWPTGVTAQSQIGFASVPGGGTVVGFGRRTLMVDASDVNVADYTAAALAAALTQKGLDALANNNYVRMTDGQIVPQNAFVYGTDYNLGDVIELRGTTSIAQKARITEYIRAQDSTGERAYPTLSVIS